MTEFTRRLLKWYRHAGRHDLPWQKHVTPYRVWVSEIMLQQTQVSTVIPYYERFMREYPVLDKLAGADLDTVLHYWSGLGYYSRARNLHRAAQIVMRDHKGQVPGDMEQLLALPGIGRSTAGAILALSMNQVHPILDGNVRRVLCRYHAIREWPGEAATEQRLWRLAERHTSRDRPADYTQAIMDLGALLCTRSRPDCSNCPLRGACRAHRLGAQQELPRKRPRKQVPVRHTAFVMIETTAGELLLQKRPPTGIWGGLWGFPECPADTDIPAWLQSRFGLQVNAIRKEPCVRHTFTHFQLDITPVRMQLLSPPERIRDEPDLCWFRPIGDNKPLGMAAPVRKLMDTYYRL
jgi:A/G-specific adenine glycosylase